MNKAETLQVVDYIDLVEFLLVALPAHLLLDASLELLFVDVALLAHLLLDASLEPLFVAFGLRRRDPDRSDRERSYGGYPSHHSSAAWTATEVFAADMPAVMASKVLSLMRGGFCFLAKLADLHWGWLARNEQWRASGSPLHTGRILVRYGLARSRPYLVSLLSEAISFSDCPRVPSFFVN
jgi:hypothetical protein